MSFGKGKPKETGVVAIPERDRHFVQDVIFHGEGSSELVGEVPGLVNLLDPDAGSRLRPS